MEDLSAKYILKILECQEAEEAYGRLRWESDQILNKLVVVLKNRRKFDEEKNPPSDQMASSLQVNRLGKWFGYCDNLGYDKIYSILEENIPIIFPDKEKLIASITKVYQENPQQVSRKILDRFFGSLKRWYE